MNLAVWTPRILSVLRIMTGLLFLEHGTGKLLGFPSSDHTASSLLSLIGFQGVLELAGGLLILLGLFTRPVAFVLAGDMRDIIVSHPESGLSVTYRKDGDAPMLVAIEGIDEIDRFDQARLNFLAKAWKAAHAKALAVGWLHS
jgi:putative oxidoreductase